MVTYKYDLLSTNYKSLQIKLMLKKTFFTSIWQIYVMRPRRRTNKDKKIAFKILKNLNKKQLLKCKF